LRADAILALLGAFIIIKGVSYTREESVFRLGDIEAKVEQKHRIPQWPGGIALGAGLVLLIHGG
jgi:hypothetical protein